MAKITAFKNESRFVVAKARVSQGELVKAGSPQFRSNFRTLQSTTLASSTLQWAAYLIFNWKIRNCYSIIFCWCICFWPDLLWVTHVLVGKILVFWPQLGCRTFSDGPWVTWIWGIWWLTSWDLGVPWGTLFFRHHRNTPGDGLEPISTSSSTRNQAPQQFGTAQAHESVANALVPSLAGDLRSFGKFTGNHRKSIGFYLQISRASMFSSDSAENDPWTFYVGESWLEYHHLLTIQGVSIESMAGLTPHILIY